MKLVINSDFGGFGLSKEAVEWLNERGLSIKQIGSLEEEQNRANKLLVECVEKLGVRANGICSSLKVVEYEEQPYYIENYDGAEKVIVSGDLILPKYEL